MIGYPIDGDLSIAKKKFCSDKLLKLSSTWNCQNGQFTDHESRKTLRGKRIIKSNASNFPILIHVVAKLQLCQRKIV